MKRIVLLIVLCGLSLVSACGGGGVGGDAAPPAARIDAGPQAILLVATGASRTLSAQLSDTNGAPASGTVTWSSSDPAVVSVDSAGTVRAMTAAGNASVTASSGALQSNPILVTIAQPVAGAQLLADSAIVSGPTAVDPAAEPAAANPYEVVLRGLPALASGTIVIASESANVAGRVVSSQPEGADQRVRLVAVPPKDLFSAFSFDETVDLAAGPFEIPADLAATYDVVQNGKTLVFTPKPGALPQAARPSDRERALAASGTQALPPLPPFGNCEASSTFAPGQPLPLALAIAPSFELTVDGSAQRVANAQGTHFVVTGNPTFKVNSTLEIRSAFEAKIDCRLTLARRVFRVPGWAGLLFGGDVEFGAGFEVGGKVTLASAKVGGSARIDASLQATLDCPAGGGNCTLGGNVTAPVALTPVLQAPSLDQLQYEPTVNLYGFVTLEAGNADIQQLQFKAIEVKAGFELGANLTLEALQITNLDPAAGRSKYALAFKGEVGPGIKLGEFLAFVGLAEVIPLKLSFAHDLGISPTAASVVADQPRYLPGEHASVTVKLAPDSTLFPSGLFYNVERVQLRRKTSIVATELLAEQLASDGQTEFVLGFDSTALIVAGEIVAFVVTRALPMDFLPALELGASRAGIDPSISAGHNTVCTVLATGTMKCWGGPGGRPRPDGGVGNSSTPTLISGIDNATAVATGLGHGCARFADGSVKCWGGNNVGQLGNSGGANSATPVAVSGIDSAISVTVGDSYSCALLADKTVRCWGANTFGQLGNGSTVHSAVPVTVTGLVNVKAIAASRFSACAVLDDGTARCWGQQITAGPTVVSRTTPQVQPGVTDAVAVSGGSTTEYACFLGNVGTVDCVGPFNPTQIGDDGNAAALPDVLLRVPDISGAVAMSSGTQQSCAVLAGGSVRCWGAAFSGALGNGVTSGFFGSPVAVSGITNAKAVSSGFNFSCALLRDDSVRCWGFNEAGQLGNGTTTNAATPVNVVGIP
jgi:alpha-tubulin suppressor-like RCC1 family protein